MVFNLSNWKTVFYAAPFFVYLKINTCMKYTNKYDIIKIRVKENHMNEKKIECGTILEKIVN